MDTNVNGNEDAMMLIFLSDYKPGNKEGKYKYKDDEFFGIQTSDAPTLCLLDCAHKAGHDISKIICIVSKDVYEKEIVQVSNEEKKTTEFQNYKNFVREKCRKKYGDEYAEKLKFEPVYYDFNPDAASDDKEIKGDKAIYIYKQIAKILYDENYQKNLSIYLDYTSGLRDVSFLMTSIIRYMEFYDIKLKKIIYSKFNRDKKEDDKFNGEIFEIDYIYGMYNLINGVSEFVSTGNANQLKMVYQNEKENMEKNELLNEISKVIETIIQFSETISLCSLSELDTVMKNVQDGINELEKKYKKHKQISKVEKEDDFYTQIFMTLLPLIKQKLYFNNNDFGYPQLIHWCIDNRMLQQALTIYTEKMPEYYFRKGFIAKEVVDINKVESKKNESSKYTTAFYTNLYDWSEAQKEEPETFFDKIRRIILEVWEDSVDNKAEKQFANELNNRIGRETDESIKLALQNFKEIVDMYASHNCNKPKIKLKDGTEEEIRETKLSKFMNSLSSGTNKDELYMIIYKKKPKKKVKKELTEEDTKTYRKKIKGIENLIEGTVKIENSEKLIDIMKYYLAVKLIRNRVNHASEKNLSTDEEVAFNKLKEYGIDIDESMRFNNIENILLQGVKCTLKYI